MSTDWSTVESGIHAWVVAGSGLAASQVIWDDQDSPRPDGVYISMQANVQTLALGWVDVEDADPSSPGAEINQIHRTQKRLTVQLQCFGGSHRGLTSSRAILDNVLDYSGLPSQIAAFKAMGWGPAELGPVQNISGVLGGATFEPRAVAQIIGYVVGEVAETSTYIQIVEVENEITGETFTVDSEV